MRVLTFAATLLAFGISSAQTDQSSSRTNAVVNKCTAADGSVIFSDKPCAGNEKAQKVDTSAALRTGSGGSNDAIAAGVADTDCRNRARQSSDAGNDAKFDESNRHIADYEQQIGTLAQQKIYASDGSGRLVDDPAAQAAIIRLRDAITREREFQQQVRTSTTAAYQTALRACDLPAANSAQPHP